MIFRLDGGVENLLALTPVLVEWRRRYGRPVMVETGIPEVFVLNPYVDAAGRKLEGEDHFYDLNLLPWPKMVKSVTEIYAERVLGDTHMASWKAVMVHSRSDDAKASKMVPGGARVAALCLDGGEMPCAMAGKVAEVVWARGYTVVDAGMMQCGSLGVQRAVISRAEVYVGVDGPTSCVAFTTDVPAVVCHTWRSTRCFWPFRRSVPYEVLGPSDNDCSMSKLCMAQNASSEFGKVYSHDCPTEPKFVCRELPFDRMVGEALDRISARA